MVLTYYNVPKGMGNKPLEFTVLLVLQCATRSKMFQWKKNFGVVFQMKQCFSGRNASVETMFQWKQYFMENMFRLKQCFSNNASMETIFQCK